MVYNFAISKIFYKSDTVLANDWFTCHLDNSFKQNIEHMQDKEQSLQSSLMPILVIPATDF
jgi:hypothetical protein